MTTDTTPSAPLRAAAPASSQEAGRERRDPAAEEALVREHLPLVGYLVSEMIGRLPAHVRREDLVGAGLAALAFAARSWDASTGVPFARYATPRIRGSFVDELRAADWASRGARARARAVTTAAEQLTVTLGREPTAAETAAALGVEPGRVTESQAAVQRAVVLSLEALDESGAVSDGLGDGGPGPEGSLLRAERLGYLRDAVEALPERLRVVVEGYFLQERPMAELAAELGVTESRISQLRAEALAVLRDGLNAALDPALVAPAANPGGVADRRRQAYFAEVAARSTYVTRLSVGRTLAAG